MERFTDADALDIGVKKEVLNVWADVMQALWTAAIEFYKKNKYAKCFPVNGNNEIRIGSRFIIGAAICNNSYVEARLYDVYTSEVRAEVRFDSDRLISHQIVCDCFFGIIKELLNSN